MALKEFITEVESIEAEAEREAKIKALMDEGKTREQAEDEVSDEKFVEFKVDGRVLRAYQPLEGQLVFMLAALGRGQSDDSRLAAIVNIMLESMRGGDKDYLEGRLLTRDPKKAIPVKQVEAIFEYVTEQWFANPTQSQSDSAESSQSDSPK